MKINWKIRLKNPVFWVTFVPSVIALVFTVLAAFDVVPSISQDTLTDTFLTVISALSAIGVLVDPTTTGVGDSARALSYDELGGGDGAAKG